MKTGVVSTVLLAGLLLAGCEQATTNNGANGAMAAPGNDIVTPAPTTNDLTGNGSAADAGNSAAPAGSASLTRDFVVGRWSVTGNCSAPEFVFNADGSVARRGQNYQWRVESGNLVITRVGQTQSEAVPVRVTSPTEMIVSGGEGPIPLTRC